MRADAAATPVTPAMPDASDELPLSGDLPPAALAALNEVAANHGDELAAMQALMRAQSAAPDHPAVLTAFYRHHFYGRRARLARDVARRALVVGARALALPGVWREVPHRALAGARADAATRFYLFALKGYAALSMRLDDPVEARDALSLLRALDPQDCVGGAGLEAMRQRAADREADAGHAGDATAAGLARPLPSLPLAA